MRDSVESFSIWQSRFFKFTCIKHMHMLMTDICVQSNLCQHTKASGTYKNGRACSVKLGDANQPYFLSRRTWNEKNVTTHQHHKSHSFLELRPLCTSGFQSQSLMRFLFSRYRTGCMQNLSFHKRQLAQLAIVKRGLERYYQLSAAIHIVVDCRRSTHEGKSLRWMDPYL